MTTLPKATLTAAVLLFTVALPVTWAQTTPAKPAPKPAAGSTGKTLSGGAAGGGKMMTREELRNCLKRQDELNQIVKSIDAQRPGLDRERDELKASGEALKAERVELDRQFQPVSELQGKVRAHAADVEAFNKRNAALAEAPRSQQEQLSRELKSERERLERVREGLATEEAKVVPAYKASAAAHNEKAVARDAKVNDWNARNSAAIDASVKQQEARAVWVNECANRPYLEDDERAIRAGK